MEIAKFKKSPAAILFFVTGIIYLLLAFRFLTGYLQPGMPLYIGLAILPFVFYKQADISSNRYLVPVLMFATLAIFIPAKSAVYFTLIFTGLLLFENFKGKINPIFLFVLVLISPIFKVFSDTLGFPLRLWLSNIVAQTMTFAGMQTKAAGNIIYTGQYQFYVDQACAGLNMLNVSLLLGIFIIGYHQKKENKTLHVFALSGFLCIIFLLNILSNFFRILLIVIFKLMPGTALHEVAGVGCMVIYVILPLMCFSSPIIRHFGKQQIILKLIKPPIPRQIAKRLLLQFGLLALLTLIILSPKDNHTINSDGKNMMKIAGYQKTQLKNNVLKFQNKQALVYLKPTPFYAPEHNPMICWTGSGYEFKFIQKQTFKGVEVYTGILEKGKDKLYAAWWFDNGTIKTINQLNWRWNSVCGKGNFYLVNVNTAIQADLQKVTESLL